MASAFSNPDQTGPPQPPFCAVNGVVNMRDAGGYPTVDGRHIVKKSILFRSGELTRLADAGGIDQFSALKIKAVFDLRSESEVSSWKSATPPVEGATFISVPVSKEEAYDPVSLAQRLTKFETNEVESFLRLYEEMLESGGSAFGTIFSHLRDHPNEPILVHCTAGKDRTGIAVALLFMVLGVSDENIAKEYELTTVGLAPVLPMLIERFKKQTVYRDNWKGALNMGNAKYDTMIATLKMIRDKYNGAEAYLRTHANMTDADFDQIRRNLLVCSSK